MPERRPPLPWTRFSYDDFFDDPAVRSMTNEEVGAYMRLLHAAHRSKTPGVLPHDDTYLSTICMWTTSEWDAHREAMGRAWFIHDGVWEQKRIVREYAEARANLESASAYGTIGARKRWGAHSPTNRVPMQEVDLDLNKEKEESKTLESKSVSEPAFSQQAQVNGLVKSLASHLGGKS